MASPNVHQSKSSHHDRLGFHPDCPTCREDRLFGALSPDPVFPRRVPVLLVTGLLALSAGATATSVAAEPDSQQEGLSAPEHVDSPAPGDSTTEIPGPPADPVSAPTDDASGDDLDHAPGSETVLPFDVGSPAPGKSPPGSGSEESMPLETEPTDDPDGRLMLTAPDPPASLPVDDVPVPPTDPVPTAPAPPAPPAPGTDDHTDSSELAPPNAKPEGQRNEERLRRDNADRRASDDGAPREGDKGAQGGGEPGGQVQFESTSTPAPPSTPAPGEAPAVSVAAAPGAVPEVSGRFHVVRLGESLWWIAADLLAQGASDAAIAREVNRLWELNRERIGTGDPDLLTVGVKLRLR